MKKYRFAATMKMKKKNLSPVVEDSIGVKEVRGDKVMVMNRGFS